ncbi:glycosyltransferase [Aeromonas veronii]|uniref:glycosyltransferase n=1 Tax=Aeromonas veronii TaxID=654 RepID=UPI00266697E4|nr:glycosyltransferase [Aeromonas veronii]MDO2434757.1 glycosyltransferase [Aeromonas veronii]
MLCTYNGSLYIKEQISSILDQKYSPSLIIISDDNSNDNTLSIICNFFDERGYENYIIYESTFKSPALNFLSAISKYNNHFDILFLSDQDDVWCQDKVELQLLKHIEIDSEKPECAIGVYSDSIVVDSSLKIINNSFVEYQEIDHRVLIDDSILFKNCVQGATLSINKNAVAMIKESLQYINVSDIYMHDWWIAILLSKRGHIHFLNKGLILYRQHERNVVGAISRHQLLFKKIKIKGHIKSCISILKQYHCYHQYIFAINNFNARHIDLDRVGLKHNSFHYISALKKIVMFIIMFLYPKLKK